MPGTDRYAGMARCYGLATGRVLRGARARLVRRCLDRGWVSVLDVGCGTGLLARDLQAGGLSVTGIDISPGMLAVAARELPPATALVRAGLPLPFADASFDASVLSLVLHESDDAPEAILAEALRVSSVCLVLEWRMPERNLDLPAQVLVHAIERLAGKGHYARFRSFARNGYLHGAAMRAGARVAAEEPLMGGTMVLAEVVPGSGPAIL